MDNDLELRSLLAAISKRWYIVVIFGILGALLGQRFGMKNPPVFEAAAILTVGLNFDYEVPGYPYEEDLALGKVSGVVQADDVLETVIRDMVFPSGSNTEELSLQKLRNMIRLQQKGSRWELTVADQDPVFAASIADRWAEASERALWDAYPHAFSAKNLQLELGETHAEMVDLQSTSSVDGSTAERIRVLEDLTTDLEMRLQEELELSRGLSTFVSFEWSQHAMVPDRPVARLRNEQIFAGNLLGIVAGIFTAILIAAISKHL